MDSITVTQYDTKPDIIGIVYQGDPRKKIVFPLIGWVGKIYIQDTSGNQIVSGENISILNPTDATWKYEWSSGSTDIAGRYYAQIKFTSGEESFTAPSDGYFVIDIIPDKSNTPRKIIATAHISKITTHGELI